MATHVRDDEVDDVPVTRRRRFMRRDTVDDGAGGRGADAAAGGLLLVARIVVWIATLLAAIIALGILFVVLDANAGNTIVSHVHDWAKSLAGPFDGMFNLHNPKTELAVNWGLAAVVYLVVGSLIASLLRRLVPGGLARPAG
jgi:hypothetical protein